MNATTWVIGALAAATALLFSLWRGRGQLSQSLRNQLSTAGQQHEVQDAQKDAQKAEEDYRRQLRDNPELADKLGVGPHKSNARRDSEDD